MAARDWYFAWLAEETDVWNPLVHARRDLDLASVSITHREEQESLVTVTIVPTDRPLAVAGTWAILAYGGPGGPVPVARMRRVKIPFRRAQDRLQLDFVCRASDHAARVATTLEPVRTSSDFDPLFATPGSAATAIEILDATTLCLHTDPVTHVVTLAEMVGAQPTRVFTDADIADWSRGGVQVSLASIPLAAVDLTVTADWTQTLGGQIDLTSPIRNATGPLLKTLTPDSLERSWPKPGDSLNGDSGYTVIASTLRKVTVKPTEYRAFRGSSGVYNYVLDPDLNAAVTRGVKVEVVHYRTEMQVAWRVDQKRSQSVRLRIVDRGQEVGTGEIRSLELKTEDLLVDRSGTPGYQQGLAYPEGFIVSASGRRWYCNVAHNSETPTFEGDIYRIVNGAVIERWTMLTENGSALGDSTRGSFFTQPRGVACVRVAILKARRILALARRCVEVQFVAPYEDVLDLRTADTVRLESAEIDGGFAQGKVTGVTIADSSDGAALATITLAASPGAGSASPAGQFTVAYSNEAWDAIGVPAWNLASFPPPPLPDGAVFLAFGVDDQAAYVNARDYDPSAGRVNPDETKPSELLKDCPTSLLFALTPLSSPPDLAWTINLGEAEWSGPKEIET